MTRRIYLGFFLIFCALESSAQYNRYVIHLKDKNGSLYSVEQPAVFLSARSIQRRVKQNIPVDVTDLPVSRTYTDSIASVQGATILNTSKWLNNVLVQIDGPDALAKINQFPFVMKAEPVATNHTPGSRPTINRFPAMQSMPAGEPLIALSDQQLSAADTINYGNNFPQIHIHEGEYLHKLGYRGQGMIIAMLDAGFFGYKTNPAFDSVRMNNRILGEYDFVNSETSVNEDNIHGANCFSILASNKPGIIVGSAPDANYFLFKTEETATEKPIEEQYWVVAAERADSAGADMISSSLGYSNFDDPTLNIEYAQRDGNTSPITRAADLAARKGMIIMNSAGNSGMLTDDFKYVMSPADGDSVVAVGAVDVNGMISPYSSWGPNGAGKQKPNIVSVGTNTAYANPQGNVETGSGTSYSNPNIAGLIACLWQAFPEFTNMDIIDAVQKSADRYNHPDERYGYGIPNMRIAYALLESKRQEKFKAILKESWISAFPVPFVQSFTVFLKAPAAGTANMRILDLSGRVVFVKTMEVQKDVYYTLHLNPPVIGSGIYYLQYTDGKNTTVLKLVRL